MNIPNDAGSSQSVSLLTFRRFRCIVLVISMFHTDYQKYREQ